MLFLSGETISYADHSVSVSKTIIHATLNRYVIRNRQRQTYSILDRFNPIVGYGAGLEEKGRLSGFWVVLHDSISTWLYGLEARSMISVKGSGIIISG